MKYATRFLEGTIKVVEFRAPHYTFEDTSIMKDRFEPARQVSRFLATQLEKSGLNVGRGIEIVKITSIGRKVETGGKQFWISVGSNRSEDWFIQIHSSTFLSRLVGEPDSAELEKLSGCLDEALRSDKKIEDIQWFTIDEWLDRFELRFREYNEGQW